MFLLGGPRDRHAGIRLPGGQWENRADATTCRPATGRLIVPDYLGLALAVACRECCATTTEDVRAGCGKVNVIATLAVGGTIIAGGDCDRDTESRRRLA